MRILRRSTADLNQRQADNGAQVQVGDRCFRADALLLGRIEGHGEQIAAGVERALDNGGRNAQVMRFESLAPVIAGHGYFKFGVFSEQQKASLTSGDRERGIDDSGEYFLS